MSTAVASVWNALLPAELNTAWLDEVCQIAAEADARRVKADYDTGSILEQEAYLLRVICERVQARTVIEVGTFIGTSTLALASASTVQRVYTCDVSNDCLPNSGNVVTFPKTTSTEMLFELEAKGVKADLCFFDGVLAQVDVELLASICSKHPVFALHDHNYGPKIRKHGMETMPRKGIGNRQLLERQWPTHVLAEPLPGTTLAVMVPEGLL